MGRLRASTSRRGSCVSKYEDLIGLTFGWLVVDEPTHTVDASGHTRIMWLCRCRCGGTTKAAARDLRAGRVRSCGCKGWYVSVSVTHGATRGRTFTPEYSTWTNMLARCRDVRRRDFKHYGGRGIRVCHRWKKFKNFLADMGPRPAKHTIERKDVNKGYTPENCVWLPRAQQNRNKRNSRKREAA